jgi:hypothetical protein
MGSWRRMPTPLLSPGNERPEVRVDSAGTGARVQDGALVQVEVEVLEPSSYHDRATREAKTTWQWIAFSPKNTDLGNNGARLALVGQTAGSVLTVDAKSRTPGQRPSDFGSPHLHREPFGSYKDALIVYDAVYRMRVKQVCPAELWEGSGTYRSVGFEAHCGGDFLPQYCSASFWRSSPLWLYKVTAKCASGTREYVSAVFGMTPKGAGDTPMQKATERLRADLTAKNPS